MANLHGHTWTFRPFFQHLARPAQVPPSRHFRATLHDPVRGKVRITGRLGPEPRDELLVVVHGLAGNASSYYTQLAARAAARVGIGCLRLELRGASRSGDDVYHAGLTSDLHAALASPELAHVRRIHLLGYSLGGHVSLRYAAEDAIDLRVHAVAAICPPIDLRRGADEIDQPKGVVYRRHVLKGLKEMYVAASKRAPLTIPIERALAVRRIREWDDLVVAPRFGFADANDYYERESVGPHLTRIGLPTLVVVAEEDPMVFSHTVRPWLDQASNITRVYTSHGGHVGFPPKTQLGLGGSGTVEEQVVDWLRRQ